MWRVTLPFLWRALVRSKSAVVVVVIGAFGAGTVATIKSLIESRIITGVANAVSDDQTGSIWSEPLGDVGPDGSDWIVDRANDLFAGLEFRYGIAVYVAVSFLGAVLVVATTSSREGISRRLFSDLFQAGLQRSFAGSTVPVDIDDEPGGMAGAIQQGGRAVSGAYALLVEAAQYLVGLTMIVFVLAQVHIGFAVLCLVVTIMLAAISWLQGRWLNERRERYDERRRSLFAFTADVLANRDVLLAHERKSMYVERLRDSSHELGTIDKDLSTRESVYLGSVNFVHDMGQIAILGVVLVAATRGTDVNAVGDAYFYVSVFARIMNPIRNLLSGYDQVRRSMSTSKTLVDLLEGHVSGTQKPAAPATDSYDCAAEFANVSFAYSPGSDAVRCCSFSVPKGGVTLIVGRSGAGKTTIARMLLGFLKATQGEVKVLGRPVSAWDHEALLREMSYLSQTGHVIDGSVRENLFAPVDAADPLLAEALQKARLANSELEALGLLELSARRLSEGQKQRLALARIFVDTAPIVVLDEPLAGVDAFTFGEVRGPMAEWLADPDRTVVMVSHRLAFASAATHVVVLGNTGGVVEEGSPADLAAEPNGMFASLLEVARSELRGVAAVRE